MKEAAGITAIVLSVVAYVPYIRDVVRKKTKPHAFSWLVWLIITLVIAFAQLAEGGGWGAIHNFTTAITCTIILVYALANKDKNITRSDIVFLALALVSIPLWAVTKQPVWSIILLTLIDLFAFYPTVRKSWSDPGSETVSSYTMAGIKYGLSLLAISTYSFATLLYPVTLVLINLLFVTLLVWRTQIVMQHQAKRESKGLGQ